MLRTFTAFGALGALALLAAPTSASAQSALMLRADADCALSINGVPQGALQANVVTSVSVAAGTALIECEAPGGAKVTHTLATEVRLREPVPLELAAKITAQTRSKDFTAPGDGTVRDGKTGLHWAQTDNGADINWTDARTYCTGLATAGGGWRLPAMDELESIYDRSRTFIMPCGDGEPCAVASPLFNLTSYWFWSNQRAGLTDAWYFSLGGGGRYVGTVLHARSDRALCVRSG